MKVFVAAVFAMIFLTGCNTAEIGKCSKQSPQAAKKIRTGFFVGRGSAGHGVFWLARMMDYSPQMELVLLDGSDIKNDKLKGLDLLVIPGGDSWAQSADIGKDGAEKIREFVRNGGAYWGICAGFHCTLNKPDRLQLVPYTWRNGVRGHRAELAMDINKKGADILGIKEGRYFVAYSRGPISKEVNEWKHGRVDTLGVYRSTVSSIEAASDFMNAPAVIYGNYGKGKVVATSFHPEMHRANDQISMGCIYAVTGVKPTPVYPLKNYRPLRAAVLISYTLGKEPVRQVLELDKEKDIDITLLGEDDIRSGILLHTDVVIIPDINVKGKKKVIDAYKKDIASFLERNGRIIAGEEIAKLLPSHENVEIIPLGKPFVKEVLKKF